MHLAALHLLASDANALPELCKKPVAVEQLLLLKEAYRLADNLAWARVAAGFDLALDEFLKLRCE